MINHSHSRLTASAKRSLKGLALGGIAAGALIALPRPSLAAPPVRGLLEISRVDYDGNTFGSLETFPFIYNDSAVTGVQGSVHIDQALLARGLPVLNTVALNGTTTSFSSKSEGALTVSPNDSYLTYIGYQSAAGLEGVSASETPGAQLTGNTSPTYNRSVAAIQTSGSSTQTSETNAYSGDNPRAVITVDGSEFYMAGNSDSSENSDGSGPGTSIGARYGTLGSNTSIQLGVYFAADRPDETTKQHIKDNNFRGIGIYNGNLYVSKGSGGNGDDGVFQVENGTGNGLPTGTANTIVQLLGAPATNPTTQAVSPYTPFGFFFANATTLYVADEGYPNLDSNGKIIVDPLAGLEKWSLIGGVWTLDYTLQQGLNLGVATNVQGYPVPTTTYGLRNLAGVVKGGTATFYAVTAQYSTISGGEPDPTSIVTINDPVSAIVPPPGDAFRTLQTSRAGEVIRGVAFVPCANAFNLYQDPNFSAATACTRQ